MRHVLSLTSKYYLNVITTVIVGVKIILHLSAHIYMDRLEVKFTYGFCF